MEQINQGQSEELRQEYFESLPTIVIKNMSRVADKELIQHETSCTQPSDIKDLRENCAVMRKELHKRPFKERVSLGYEENFTCDAWELETLPFGLTPIGRASVELESEEHGMWWFNMLTGAAFKTELERGVRSGFITNKIDRIPESVVARGKEAIHNYILSTEDAWREATIYEEEALAKDKSLNSVRLNGERF